MLTAYTQSSLTALAKIHAHEAKRKQAFGQLVQGHRNRRKLSRRKLEQHCGVPDRTIVDIEKGHKTYLDRKTVSMLASAFNLSIVQQRTLVLTAGLVPDIELNCPDFYDMVRNFYAATDGPAFMFDGLFDLHSCNSQMLALFGLPLQKLYEHAYTGAGPNILRFLFDPVFDTHMTWGEQWPAIALRNVQLFRVACEPHVHEPRYAHLLRELHKLPEFSTHWQTSDAMREPPLPPYTSTLHSAFGTVHILHAELTTNEVVSPHLRAAIYLPLGDDETHATFKALRAQVMKSALQFGSCEIARFTRIL